MFTTGSKLLIGAAVWPRSAPFVYGVTEGGALGTVGLSFAAAALFGLAGVTWHPRRRRLVDGHRRAPPSPPPPRRRRAPACGRSSPPLGGVLVAVGLVTYPVVFIFGIIALLAATAEWMVQAWSERASADAGFNADVRTRIAHPLEFPVLAAIGVGIIVYSFSRIMLFLSKTGGPVVFAVIATLVLVAGFILAFRPTLRSGAVATVAVIAALGLVDRRRRRRPRGRARTAPARDHRRPRRARASATRPTRPRPTRTPRRPWRPRPTSPPSHPPRTARSSPTTPASTGDQDDRRRHPRQPDQRPASATKRRGAPLVLDPGTRPRSTSPASDRRHARCRTSSARPSSRTAAASC